MAHSVWWLMMVCLFHIVIFDRSILGGSIYYIYIYIANICKYMWLYIYIHIYIIIFYSRFWSIYIYICASRIRLWRITLKIPPRWNYYTHWRSSIRDQIPHPPGTSTLIKRVKQGIWKTSFRRPLQHSQTAKPFFITNKTISIYVDTVILWRSYHGFSTRSRCH